MSWLPPPPQGPQWSAWGERLNTWLVRTKDQLRQLTSGETASEDGFLMWDREDQQVVVSKDGEFVALRYGHGDHLLVYTTATHSAASINTPYAITWENSAYGDHITVDGSVTSRIVFDHAGTYKIDFSCELQSNNTSDKTIYIWPRKNGSDIPFSTIVHSVKNAGESKVVSRTGMFDVEPGDYIEAMFAVTNTGLRIDGTSATAFSPAAPSATMVITEVDL